MELSKTELNKNCSSLFSFVLGNTWVNSCRTLLSSEEVEIGARISQATGPSMGAVLVSSFTAVGAALHQPVLCATTQRQARAGMEADRADGSATGLGLHQRCPKELCPMRAKFDICHMGEVRALDVTSMIQ